MALHTLSVLVEDKPGVLTRVSGLFSRRLFNILSLAVGPTENPGVSRITVVTEGDAHTMEQITKQLNKLIHVLKVVELPAESSTQRDHILIKVKADPVVRLQIVQAVTLFRASVIDVSPSPLSSRQPAPRKSSTHCWKYWNPSASAKSFAQAPSPWHAARAP